MEWSLCCRASRCSSAEEGQTRQAGPRAVKEKNIPRPANCCSQLPPPLLLGVKKKNSASSSGRCKRMQNFNHLLHQPGLPQAKFAGTRQWHHGKGVVGSPHAFSVRYREVKASSVSLSRARVWSTRCGCGFRGILSGSCTGPVHHGWWQGASHWPCYYQTWALLLESKMLTRPPWKRDEKSVVSVPTDLGPQWDTERFP